MGAFYHCSSINSNINSDTSLNNNPLIERNNLDIAIIDLNYIHLINEINNNQIFNENNIQYIIGIFVSLCSIYACGMGVIQALQ